MTLPNATINLLCRAARAHTSGRDSLDKLLDRALAQGPILIVAGEHRVILCLESNLPGFTRPDDKTSMHHEGTADIHQNTEELLSDVLDFSAVTLTPRELEIAQLAASGQKTAQIAQTLGIASQTVRVHLKSIRSRCRASTTEEAIHALARQHSWPI